MEDLKFLGTINGIYNLGKESQETNIYTLLLVYIDKRKSTLKVEYTNVFYNSTEFISRNDVAVSKGEIDLSDVAEMETSLLVTNFNERWAKEVIFNKYLDWRGDCLIYDKIY